MNCVTSYSSESPTKVFSSGVTPAFVDGSEDPLLKLKLCFFLGEIGFERLASFGGGRDSSPSRDSL